MAGLRKRELGLGAWLGAAHLALDVSDAAGGQRRRVLARQQQFVHALACAGDEGADGGMADEDVEAENK